MAAVDPKLLRRLRARADVLLVLLLTLGSLAALATPAAAQDKASGNPYAHGLRLLLFPATFSTGISQSSFGSALRAELDLGRFAMLQAGGGVGWAPVAGDDSVIPYNLRLGVSIALFDRVSVESLEGTVHATDAASVGGQRRGTDSDLEVPISQKLGGPPPPVRERGEYERASVRNVHALRLGYDHQRSLQRTADIHADNRVHALSLGYGWATHWNLLPHEAGERALGYRRFYIDALATLPGTYTASNIPAPADPLDDVGDEFLVGVRLGMEGAFAALLRSAEAIGFGYSLEVGALPGRGGAEGYLLIGLGLALEVDTSAR